MTPSEKAFVSLINFSVLCSMIAKLRAKSSNSGSVDPIKVVILDEQLGLHSCRIEGLTLAHSDLGSQHRWRPFDEFTDTLHDVTTGRWIRLRMEVVWVQNGSQWTSQGSLHLTMSHHTCTLSEYHPRQPEQCRLISLQIKSSTSLRWYWYLRTDFTQANQCLHSET